MRLNIIICFIFISLGFIAFVFAEKNDIEFVVQTGHSCFVESVAFSPDGQTIASGSDDNTIKIWDTGAGKLLNTLQGHSSFVESIAFSPDGKILASGSSDKTIKIWDTGTGKLLNTLQGHSSYVYSVSFSPDGQTIASGSCDKTIKLWDTETGKLLNTLKGHSDQVNSVAFSPDGKILATGSMDKTIKLWDTGAGKLLNTLKGHFDYVISVAFSPDGKILASGSSNKTITLWDTETGKLLNTLQGHSSYVNSSAVSPDGKMPASGNMDEAMKAWDTRKNKLEDNLQSHLFYLFPIAFSPDGKTLASGSSDKTITLWDTRTGKLLNTLQGQSSYIYSVAFSTDGKILTSVSDDCTIHFWDVKTGKLFLVSYRIDNDDYITYNPEFGYYTASGKGVEYASWRINNQFYSVEQYSNVFFRPDLITDLMAGKAVPSPQVNIMTSLPPDFVFNKKISILKENQITLTFNYKGNAPLGDLSAILNNEPIDITIKQDTLSEKAVSVTLNLPNGQNILKIRAIDKNFLKSSWYSIDFDFNGKKVTLYSTAKGMETTVLKKRDVGRFLGNYGNKYAVVMGISDYKNLYKDKTVEGLYDLNYADKDAEKFNKFLDSDASGGNWNRTLLINKDATTEAIDTKLSNVLMNAKEDDLIYIFFSGHGRRHNIHKNRIYLLTYDFEPANYMSGYNYSDLLEMVKESKAEHIILFIDACKSGAIGLGKGKITNPDFRDPLKERIIEFSKNKVFFTSATGDQTSYEYTDKQMGYFSYFLLEGLKGKAKEIKNPEFIDLSELFTYVGTEVFNETSKKEKTGQKPDLIFIEGADFDDYPVAIRK